MRNLTFKPTVEILDDRIVPAVGLENWDIVVTGRDDVFNARVDSSDTVTVSWMIQLPSVGGKNPAPAAFYRVIDNGGVTDIPTGQVTGGDVVFLGLGGNDRFENRSGLRGELNGGTGHDTAGTAQRKSGGGPQEYWTAGTAQRKQGGDQQGY